MTLPSRKYAAACETSPRLMFGDPPCYDPEHITTAYCPFDVCSLTTLPSTRIRQLIEPDPAFWALTTSEASLGPPRWAAGVGWDRCGWLLVEKRSEPALAQ
jgi:hypothetical protein